MSTLKTEVPNGSVIKATVSGTWNVLSMMWRSWNPSQVYGASVQVAPETKIYLPVVSSVVPPNSYAKYLPSRRWKFPPKCHSFFVVCPTSSGVRWRYWRKMSKYLPFVSSAAPRNSSVKYIFLEICFHQNTIDFLSDLLYFHLHAMKPQCENIRNFHVTS